MFAALVLAAALATFFVLRKKKSAGRVASGVEMGAKEAQGSAEEIDGPEETGEPERVE